MNKKKALLIGDYTHPKFHPLQGVDAEITHTLQDWMSVQCSENKNMFEFSNLGTYDLCISYLDRWSEKLSLKQTGGLLSFVSGGGGLLVLHNGIIIDKRNEIAQLMGARHSVNPARSKLSMRVADPQHVIMEGIESFEIEDEPYRFEFDPFTDKTILLEYQSGEEWLPAAWVHTYGLGRVVYLMPGNDQPAFQHPMYRKMVLQAAKWAARISG
ncbi:type 1 glutamine amidotransferase [Paenibacillus shirakamiensis]|uniref:Type 1 glutamine amidotransferase n=1 Tax=Paenibacillus shirakamiensis TaxID=1265935 RepID=A0ABS4JJJ0_9BACL|nr:ThuA domain-containing protein [Paenibacillus shirakamiensis]MBP2001874.1 type 1 glutamine amidotransferase [Paenibacillus shirakamiensis]